jgi:hypothetical protein
VLAPGRADLHSLAALPSTRAIETRSLPTSLAATHRGFAFYVAFPESSIETRSLPRLLAVTGHGFTLITRTSQCLRQLPSCVAVYPRDSQSRRVLRRCSRQLHCISLAPARLDRYPRGFTGHVAHPSRSILSLFGVQMPPKAGATRALRPFLDSSRRRPSKNSRSRIVGLRLFLIDDST